MRRIDVQKTIALFILASYLAVGMVGHLHVFPAVAGWSSDAGVVAQSKPGPPAPAKVFWRQFKHVPSVTNPPTVYGVVPCGDRSTDILAVHQMPSVRVRTFLPLVSVTPAPPRGPPTLLA